MVLGALQIWAKDHGREAGVNNRQAKLFTGRGIGHGDARGGLDDAHPLALRAAVLIKGGGDAEAVKAGID